MSLSFQSWSTECTLDVIVCVLEAGSAKAFPILIACEHTKKRTERPTCCLHGAVWKSVSVLLKPALPTSAQYSRPYKRASEVILEFRGSTFDAIAKFNKLASKVIVKLEKYVAYNFPCFFGDMIFFKALSAVGCQMRNVHNSDYSCARNTAEDQTRPILCRRVNLSKKRFSRVCVKESSTPYVLSVAGVPGAKCAQFQLHLRQAMLRTKPYSSFVVKSARAST